MMMVLLNVNHVHTNVLVVLKMLTIVTLVPKTESMLHIVIVHSKMVTMKLLVKLIAQNVPHNVYSVLNMKFVSIVLLTDYKVLNQNVHVHLIIMKTPKKSVSLVTLNVKNVLNKLIIVTLVLVTELKLLFVIVHQELFKILKNKSVHLVTNTVLLVWEPQKIVYNVLKPDITHQSVHLFHNGPNQLKLLIFQLVLLLLLLVKLNVLLVLTPLEIVKLVMLTDLILHSVLVMMVIMKMLMKSVKNVQSNVHIVLIQLLV
jgi:hypothetical protein